MKPCHDLCSNDFIKRLLTERIGTAFDQTAFAIYDLPTLFQEAVRGVIGRGEVQRIRLLGCAEQDITDIIRERMMEEIDVIPSQVAAFGFDPVLIGQTQTIAPDQEQLCIGYFESFKGFSDSASACRDGSVCPPSIEGGSICYSVFDRNANR